MSDVWTFETERLRAAVTTNVGPRATNQDRFIVCLERTWMLLAVADGMGGGQFGEEAAALAIEAFESAGDWPPGLDNEAVTERLEAICETAAERICAFGLVNECSPGTIATTLTGVAISPDLTRMAVAHVGDTRAYRFVPGERLQAITEDHADGNVLLRALSNDPNFSRYPDRGVIPISRDVPVVIAVFSDGFWGACPESELEKAMSGVTKTRETMEDALARLVEVCRPVTRDNFTGVIAIVEPNGTRPSPMPTNHIKRPWWKPWTR